MSDLISRQAAIDAMLEIQKEDDEAYGCQIVEAFDGDRAAEALKSLPSVQPEQRSFSCSQANDMISRQAAIDLIEYIETERLKGNVGLIYAPTVKGLRALPSIYSVIRCEECKYWIPGYIANTGDGIDADVDVDRFDYFVPPRCGKYQQMVGHSASDYCSLAEAKEDIR